MSHVADGLGLSFSLAKEHGSATALNYLLMWPWAVMTYLRMKKLALRVNDAGELDACKRFCFSRLLMQIWSDSFKVSVVTVTQEDGEAVPSQP
jgi:hypothetical protein